MDITPLIPQGRNVITGYGEGGFIINGERKDGSLIIFPDRVLPWPVQHAAELAEEHFIAITAPVELLLLGAGATLEPVSKEIRTTLRQRHIALDLMDTGAACRTYNVLLAEGRAVAAALIAV